jgi:TonB family protein
MRPARSLAVVSLLAALAAPLFAQEPLAAGSDGVPVPKKTKHVQPVYPAEALAQGIRGIVILDVVVGTTGRVESTSIIRSVPGLDEAAIAAARQWEYEPVKVDGKLVAVRLTVPITFALALPKIARDAGVPELRQGAAPAWPSGAPEGGGAAAAEVTLEPDGRIGDARIADGVEPWAGALLAALRTWRFPPPDEDAVVSFKVSAEFVGGKPDQRRVELKASGLHKAELLAAAQPAGGAPPVPTAPAAPGATVPAAPPPAPTAVPASAAAAPFPTAAAPAATAPPPQAPAPPRPADPSPAAAAPTTPAPAGSAHPPASTAATPGGEPGLTGTAAAPAPQPPDPAHPTQKAPPASAPTPPTTPPPGAPAAPGSVPDTATPPRVAPPAAAPPPSRAPAGGAATPPAGGPPAGGTPAGAPPTSPRPGATAAAAAPAADLTTPPPVEVITAPPPAAPPENGVSAVHDVTLQPGVPDLTRGRRPVSPPIARMSGTTGTVEVAFSVSAGGTTTVQSVVGPEPLRRAAQEAVASWVFRRARADRAYLVASFNYAEDKTTAEIRPQPTPTPTEGPAPGAAPGTSLAPAAPAPPATSATPAPSPGTVPPSAAPAPKP